MCKNKKYKKYNTNKKNIEERRRRKGRDRDLTCPAKAADQTKQKGSGQYFFWYLRYITENTYVNHAWPL